MEVALVEGGAGSGPDPHLERLDEIPFDPDRKRLSPSIVARTRGCCSSRGRPRNCCRVLAG
jgi:hypothetical protein